MFGQRFDASGDPVGNEFQLNSFVTGGQYSPSISSLINGGFVATWTSYDQDGDNSGVFGQVFDASGTSLGDEFQVNTYIQSIQYNPSVASLSNGGFIITWISHGQDGSDKGVFGQRYGAGGSPEGSEFQINSYATSVQTAPEVSALPDGGFVVTWESSGQDGNGYGVFAKRFDLDGAPVGDEFQVNSTTLNQQNQPSIGVLSDGGLVVTWTSGFYNDPAGQDGDGTGIFGQRFDTTSQILVAAATATTTIDVTDANEAPVTVIDFASTAENASITFDVLANDSDSDGGTLSVTEAAIQSGAGGSVAVNGDNTLTFDPGANYHYLAEGQTVDVTIEYTVSDDQGGISSGTATVTVTGNNDGLVAVADANTVSEDTAPNPVSGNVLTNDTDADGDSLSVSEVNGIGGNVGQVVFGTYGTVTINADGSYSYTGASKNSLFFRGRLESA